MKKEIVFLFLICSFFISPAQKFSIAADKTNIFYLGVPNPLTIAVENYSCNAITVKTNNGKVSGRSGSFIYEATSAGITDIILFRRIKGHLKEIGRSTFRIKNIPDPIAKVGPSAGGNISKVVLRNQQYIRAELENFDFQLVFPIDSFTVCIIRGDTCLYKEINNSGNKFEQGLTTALNEIKKGDTVIFKKIFAHYPDRSQTVLNPILLFITD